MSPEARAAQLREELHRHNWQYFARNEPLISDAEYDRLLAELRALEEAHPALRTPDSPTQRAGSDLAADFPKVVHPAPALSLANAFDEDGLRAWEQRNLRLLPPGTQPAYTLEPKLDGLSLILTYEQGRLTRAATRGDGEQGDEVTANARTIRSLPLRIPRDPAAPSAPPLLVVRGEVLFHKQDFVALNRQQEAQGLPHYVNARNTAAGALKQKDSRITASRPLAIYVYDVLAARELETATQHELLEALRALGFHVPPEARRHESLDALIAALPAYEARRAEFPFEIDGMVIKLDDRRLARQLGVVGKDPRGAIAWKFAAEEASTKLLEVTVNVGRSGKLTPTARLTPVFVGGVTVSSASLHNYGQIARLDLRLGDTVIVKRSGDVIPYIVGPLVAARDGSEQAIRPPQTCPFSGDAVIQPAGAVDHYCASPACPERVFRQVEFFVSRGALDIEGMGPETIRTLINAGLVRDEADLFRLPAEALLGLEGFAEKKVARLLNSLERAKSRPLPRLLAALGIDGVGGTVANLLAAHFPSLTGLAALAQATRNAEEQFQRLAAPQLEALAALETRDAEQERALRRLRAPLLELAPRCLDTEDVAARLPRLPAAAEEEIAALAGSLAALTEAVAPLLRIEGLGPILAANIIAWFAEAHNRHVLEKLEAAGLSLRAEKVSRPQGQVLAGRTFVLTGKLPSLTRGAAKKLIEAHGGRVSGNVSRKTDYLLAGESPGSKAQKAAQLGIPVLDETGLQELLASTRALSAAP